MTSRLRILMISPQFHPLLGGYERAAMRLSQGLVSRGHEVEVVAERREKEWPKAEMIDGVAVRRLWCIYQKGPHVLSTVFSLSFFLLTRGRRFDVWHVHQYGWPATAAVLLGHLLGRPVVLKLTSTERLGIWSVIEGRSPSWLHRWAHQRVDACVATSDRASKEARAFGVPVARIRRIPNGLDTEAYRPVDANDKPEERRRLGIHEGFLSIAVGRLDGVKNYEMMIRAWSQFAGSRDDVRLVILGDGPCRVRLEKSVVASGASGSITLAGSVSDPRPWYRVADLYLLSSDLEGLSNSLMEALSSGTPMLSTRVSGSEDVIAEAAAGGLVDVGDAVAFSREISRFHADPGLLASCAKEARRYAIAHYSMSSVLDAVESAYRDCVARRAKAVSDPAGRTAGPS